MKINFQTGSLEFVWGLFSAFGWSNLAAWRQVCRGNTTWLTLQNQGSQLFQTVSTLYRRKYWTTIVLSGSTKTGNWASSKFCCGRRCFRWLHWCGCFLPRGRQLFLAVLLPSKYTQDNHYLVPRLGLGWSSFHFSWGKMNHMNSSLDPVIQEFRTACATKATWTNINDCRFSGLSGSH